MAEFKIVEKVRSGFKFVFQKMLKITEDAEKRLDKIEESLEKMNEEKK